MDYAIAHGMARDDAEKAAHLLARGPSCFLCLNAFPYTTGHILIVPYRHLDSLAALPPGEAQEMISLAQRVESVLREPSTTPPASTSASISARPEALASPATSTCTPCPAGSATPTS